VQYRQCHHTVSSGTHELVHQVLPPTCLYTRLHVCQSGGIWVQFYLLVSWEALRRVPAPEEFCNAIVMRDSDIYSDRRWPLGAGAVELSFPFHQHGHLRAFGTFKSPFAFRPLGCQD
jgi:hypothetical protein